MARDPAGAAAIAFGPVPSRRLGRSLGINNIPPKACSYSCIYCQVGPTREREIEPRAFHAPRDIERVVSDRVQALERAGERIDYLTFVPDGEPTLDAGLARAIELLRPLGYPIAVISNATLVWRAEVRAALCAADWLSLKVDAVEDAVWRRVNRPHEGLALPRILAGIEQLARDFAGTLTTETMLVEGVNDGAESLRAVADFLHGVEPSKVYLLVPVRPPAEPWVRPPDEAGVNRAFQIFSARLGDVECITGDEPGRFASTGDVAADLLNVTAVHPMREDSVRELLAERAAQWDVVEALLAAGELRRVEYGGRAFYMRAFSGARAAPPR